VRLFDLKQSHNCCGVARKRGAACIAMAVGSISRFRQRLRAAVGESLILLGISARRMLPP
jgi:hypothetical protein